MEPATVHGQALAEVLVGVPSVGVARLTALVAPAPEDASLDAARRDLARMAAWDSLVERFWAEAIAEQLKLTLTVRGKRLTRVVITGREPDGTLLVGTNKFGVRRFQTLELDLAELESQIGKASDALRGDPARRWLQLLQGEPKAQRWVEKGDDPEALALAPDAALYPDLLQRGSIALAWEAGTGDVASYDPARVERELARLEELRGTAHPLFVKLRAGFRTIAGRFLARELDLAGPEALVAGRLESLGDERVRLTYTFDTRAEAEDWIDAPRYLEHVRKRLNPLAGAGHDPAIRWEEGELVAHGSGCWRLEFALEGPTTARWTTEFRPTTKQVDPTAIQFFVGIQDDGKGTYAAVMDFGNLEVAHARSGQNRANYNPLVRIDLTPKRAYQFELTRALDGATSCRIGGRLARELTALPDVHGGGAFLWVHSDLPVVIREFSVEGTLTPENYEAARARRVERLLVERGW